MGQSGCPQEETLVAFVERRAPDHASLRVQDHLEHCTACDHVVAELLHAIYSGADLDTTRQLERDAETPLRSPVRAGETVGRYVVADLLGVGGMSVVHAAHDPQLHRTVALKLMRVDRGLEARDASARLVLEAQAMARLSHPNVVAVYDAGSYEDYFYIVMELVRGETLASWLSSQPRSRGDVLAVFSAAGQGLTAAHRVGIVHRDFKPHNVLVGADDRVRVTDFGLARAIAAPRSANSVVVIGEAAADARASHTGAITGTPAFMAPEQFLGRAVTPKADQFAFSVALYRALYRRAPFSGHTLDDLAEAVVNGEPRAPHADEATDPIWRVLRRGLATAPEDRYPTLEGLLAELDTQRSHAAPASERRSVSRRRVGLAIVATLGLGGAAIAISAASSTDSSSSAAVPIVAPVATPAPVPTAAAPIAQPPPPASPEPVASTPPPRVRRPTSANHAHPHVVRPQPATTPALHEELEPPKFMKGSGTR